VWWQRFRAERAAGVPQQGQPRLPGQPQESSRPKLVWLKDCRRVLIEGVTLMNSPQFHLVPLRCTDVTIQRITITAPADSPNTDGIDPTSSRNVLISHCTVDVGDDNVSFKSNPKDGPLENVLVTDCTFRHGHGASVGSNIGGGIRQIVVQNCTFDDTDNGVRIKSARDRGGIVEDITYRDLIMNRVATPITINLFYFDKSGYQEHKARPVTNLTPVVRRVRIINITAQDAKTAGEIIGLPEMPVTDVLLENVSLAGKTGMTVRDARGELRGVTVRPQRGEPISISDADFKTTRKSG
jgi:polygalacturonase